MNYLRISTKCYKWLLTWSFLTGFRQSDHSFAQKQSVTPIHIIHGRILIDDFWHLRPIPSVGLKPHISIYTLFIFLGGYTTHFRSKPYMIYPNIPTNTRFNCAHSQAPKGRPCVFLMIYHIQFLRLQVSPNQIGPSKRNLLVGGIPTPLKNMSSSVGSIITIIHYYSQYMEK